MAISGSVIEALPTLARIVADESLTLPFRVGGVVALDAGDGINAERIVDLVPAGANTNGRTHTLWQRLV
jgi:hypothetical protein